MTFYVVKMIIYVTNLTFYVAEINFIVAKMPFCGSDNFLIEFEFLFELFCCQDNLFVTKITFI